MQPTSPVNARSMGGMQCKWWQDVVVVISPSKQSQALQYYRADEETAAVSVESEEELWPALHTQQHM